LIESDDHLIIFMQDRRKTVEVEKLFQVSVTFM
jgi:trk system potassium uptake protein TrkA